MSKHLDPIPPGEILFEEFMQPLGISMNALARDLGVPPNRISEIVAGRRALTADTALRLAVYFRTNPELWLNLQTDYDLRMLRRERGPDIEAQVRRRAA
ncbi:HigA family addiction module antitoxin [Luteimonas sp. 8-5]|jgi:addiction module HigA family antidote|uniref:HigA family addiction module antitoxin n=1 Tax=Luteimonas sp. 8-5 TaxID=3039387 RepID=UPI0024364512|nr:HigA family addiction module antitoxin [Luteimonas sp. 8-5]MDG6348111.1 HigA family addiction module antitoxin [Luteimonas sp. 8-5]